MKPNKVICLFEQSGTFSGEFRKLGIPAYDVDILNDYGCTDIQTDIFAHIERAYSGAQSLFDMLHPGDLAMAFFPCTYFCENNCMFFCGYSKNQREQTMTDKIADIIDRSDERQRYYKLLLQLCALAETRNFALIIENPFGYNHYLYNNFPYAPAIIDKNRMLSGDYYVKPTQYFFINCEPTQQRSFQLDKKQRYVQKTNPTRKSAFRGKLRSEISPDYARNFILDKILGEVHKYSMPSLFNN